MNKTRRKKIADLCKILTTIEGVNIAQAEKEDRLGLLIEEVEDVRSDLEELLGEEQDYLDNMPESLQGGSPGEAAQDAIEQMETAASILETAVTLLGEPPSRSDEGYDPQDYDEWVESVTTTLQEAIDEMGCI